MQVRLQVLRGAKTKEMMLRLPSVIGRGGEAKLKVPASTVSRHHCEIYAFEGAIAVRDLGSSNGTVVNGHKITGPTFLTPEDELTIGPITARVELSDEPNTPANATNGSTDNSSPAQQPETPSAEENVDDIPTFEELPAELAEPIVAEPIVAEPIVADSVATDSVVGDFVAADSEGEAVVASPLNETTDTDESNSPNAGDSVLHYTEPKQSSGRSFVGISLEQETPDAVEELPVFDESAEDKPQVDSEDTSLNAFFKNLDS